jgi:hypothetical protein
MIGGGVFPIVCCARAQASPGPSDGNGGQGRQLGGMFDGQLDRFDASEPLAFTPFQPLNDTEKVDRPTAFPCGIAWVGLLHWTRI